MFGLLSAMALAGSAPLASPAAPPEACAGLAAKLDSRMFAVVTSEVVAAKADIPAYCRVKGTIRPTIGFEMRLPVSGWNGKFYQTGCGAYCGVLTSDVPGFENGIVESLRRGYASIHTDSGHQGASPRDSSWAFGNRDLLELYAHRWVPLAYAAGISVTTRFYGRAPKQRYLVGCSNGGRIGLMTAQRYPKLFDGIIIGCPVIDFTNTGGTFGVWKLRTNRDATTPVLGPDFVRKLPFLTAALNEQCDALDGAADGLVLRPETCRIDYSRIRLCPEGINGPQSPDDCLTTTERDVVRLWHEGPVDSKGRKLFGGMPVGSEDEWRFWYLRDPSKAAGTQLAEGFTRNIVSDPRWPELSPATFDFDRDPARLARDFAFLNATDTDLSAFRAAGGKIIMWHGSADPLVVPSQSVNYYNAVTARMGGLARVQPFFRFFEAPGLGHCWVQMSRSAPEEFDPLTAMEDWIERGIAPQKIVARPSKRQTGNLTVTEVHYRPYPLAPRVIRAAK